MDTSTPQGMNSTHTNETPEGMFWSAAESARQCGVSRATIDRALKSGKLAAEKDEEGAWRISPHALAEAGLNPGKPSPPEDEKPHERDDVLDRDRMHELEKALLRAEVREQRTRADGLERVLAVYERQIEQGKRPHAPLESTQTNEQPEPVHTHTPDPVRPSQANVGRLRRALNVWRYG